MIKYFPYLFLLFSSCVFATDVTSTRIKAVMMDENNGEKLYLKLDSELSPSGCRTNIDWPFVVDLSSNFGKKLHANILSAHAAQRTVTVRGKSTCLVHSGVETMYRLEVY